MDEVAALNHEIPLHSMEGRSLVALWVIAKPELAGAELSEVFSCPWKLMLEQLDLDAAKWLGVEIYIQENNRVIWVQEVILVL